MASASARNTACIRSRGSMPPRLTVCGRNHAEQPKTSHSCFLGVARPIPHSTLDGMTPSAPLPRPRRANFAGDRVPVKRLRAAGVLSPSCAQALERANRWLGHQNGGEAPTFPLRIELADDRQRPPALGDDESYRLRISSAGAVVSAATLAGVNWALATLVQLADRDSCPADWGNQGRAGLSLARAHGGRGSALHLLGHLAHHLGRHGLAQAKRAAPASDR